MHEKIEEERNKKLKSKLKRSKPPQKKKIKNDLSLVFELLRY